MLLSAQGNVLGLGGFTRASCFPPASDVGSTFPLCCLLSGGSPSCKVEVEVQAERRGSTCGKALESLLDLARHARTRASGTVTQDERDWRDERESAGFSCLFGLFGLFRGVSQGQA